MFFSGDRVEIRNRGKNVAFGVKQENQIFRMLFRVKYAEEVDEANVAKTGLQVWHERFGHVNGNAMRELVKKGLVKGVELPKTGDVFCDVCQIGKSHRQAFRNERVRATTKPGEVIHTDVCGPMNVESQGGAQFLLTFKDDATSFRHIYFLKHKSDVFDKFRVYDKLVENKFGRVMRVLRSDNGREFRNKNMDEYLESRGIERERTAPYTPEQNGKAERDNRTIIESARTMLHAKELPKTLWAEACNTAVYLMNRAGSSSARNGATPYEGWMGIKPNLKHLRIFGSEAFVNVPKQQTTKFDARARRMILVGYENNSSNYRVYDPQSKKVSVSRDVVFREKIGKMTLPINDDTSDEIVLPKAEREVAEERGANEEREDDDNDDVFLPAAEEAVNVRPELVVQAPRVEPQHNLRDRGSIRRPSRYESNVVEYDVPTTYEEAMRSEDSSRWTVAIKKELEAHNENETWSLVERRPEMKIIDSRWVFRIKKDNTGNVCRYKARLCARGFMQRKGVDFTETFAPVVRYDSVRVLLAIVAERNYNLAQFDVQTAFLYGKLDEEIFMEIPEGLSVKGSSVKNIVCRLEKSLYGLKQAPRCWNREFSSFLREFKFRETDADHCIFVGDVSGSTVYLALYVDDGLIAAESDEVLERVLLHLGKSFKITIGDSSLFVGMQIERNRNERSVFVHQSAYAERVVKKFGMGNAKSLSVRLIRT